MPETKASGLLADRPSGTAPSLCHCYVSPMQIALPPAHLSSCYFCNDTTAYRKLPFAYPLRIARNACRKATPSLPWLKANAQSDGLCINDHEISLKSHVPISWWADTNVNCAAWDVEPTMLP